MKQLHEIAPVYSEDAEILILGSFPSVLSRKAGFYYAHPQNRFWKTLSAIFGESAGDTKEEKTAFLKKHKIALWDVVGSCEIEGSKDPTIKRAEPNDIKIITSAARIKAVFTNGKKAHELYLANLAKDLENVPVINLPSTSPANARLTLEKLVEVWGTEIKKVLT